MKVSELIEYLKTLNQDFKVLVGDSEYPNEEIDENDFYIHEDEKEYVIY